MWYCCKSKKYSPFKSQTLAAFRGLKLVAYSKYYFTGMKREETTGSGGSLLGCTSTDLEYQLYCVSQHIVRLKPLPLIQQHLQPFILVQLLAGGGSGICVVLMGVLAAKYSSYVDCSHTVCTNILRFLRTPLLESFSPLIRIHTDWLIHTYVWHCVENTTNKQNEHFVHWWYWFMKCKVCHQITPQETILQLLTLQNCIQKCSYCQDEDQHGWAASIIWALCVHIPHACLNVYQNVRFDHSKLHGDIACQLPG